jgi:exocyst complex component 6
VSADEVEVAFSYAERSLKLSEKACDAQVGSTYSVVYDICRSKIDSHINYSLDSFNWVAKTARETPNPYCEGLIGYLKTVFASLGPMDEGSKAGLHFSCCGHVSECIVRLLSGKPGDTASMDTSSIPPITRIDAFGIYNLRTDCEEFERFADSTGVPSLHDCFGELRMLTCALLDKELPTLLLAENAAARRRKYPLLSLDKVGNILEKYVGTGMVSTSLCILWIADTF